MAAEEQQETLRRFVDEWGATVKDLLHQAHPWEWAPTRLDRASGALGAPHISAKPQEYAEVHELVISESVLFNKVITVLAYDCHQIAALREEVVSTVYPHLITFALRANVDEAEAEGEAPCTLARAFHRFQHALTAISRLRLVLGNLLQQLNAITAPDDPQVGPLFSTFREVHLPSAAAAVGQGLAMLVAVDELIAHNKGISHCIASYTRMLESMRADPAAFATSAEKVEALSQAIRGLQEFASPPGFFQRFVQEDVCSNPALAMLRTNRRWQEEMTHDAWELLSTVGGRAGTVSERLQDREQLVGALASVALLSWTCDSVSPRLLRSAWDLHLRVPLLPICGCVSLLPCSFLATSLSPRVATSGPPSQQPREILLEASRARREALSALDGNLAKDLLTLTAGAVSWMVRMEAAPATKVEVKDRLREQMGRFDKGLCLANRLRLSLLSSLELHSIEGLPMTRAHLAVLAQLAELVKAMDEVFRRTAPATALGLGHLTHVLHEDLRRLLFSFQSHAEEELALGKSRGRRRSFLALPFNRAKDDDGSRALDHLAAVSVALGSAEGCGSQQRRAVSRVALDVALGLNKAVGEQTAAEARELNRLLDLASAGPHLLVREACDCSVLYWHQSTLPALFDRYLACPELAPHLRYMVGAFCDGSVLLRVGGAEEQVVAAYEAAISDALRQRVLQPACLNIETDLRLHAHAANLDGAVSVNPTKTGLKDLSHFLAVPPIQIGSTLINFKEAVEEHLNASFYNHTAVALHSWKMYEEMRAVAEEKYCLRLADARVPGHAAEQGLDILEIMRNIHLFCASFSFNLLEQAFIEDPSAAAERKKYLSTVGVSHVVSAMRVHGVGFAHTLVNFVYQFLAQKFVVFSQFLFDDHIKSLLLKELLYCQESGKSIGHKYPVERAENVNKGIRKLGVTKDGLSFLDQFRCLITEIGNGVGFVRMVRTGGLRFAASASSFAADTPEDWSFEEAAVAGEGQHSERTVQAARALDAALASLRDGTSAAHTDYLAILVNVFGPELRTGNEHLRAFHVIVPALIINAVEAMLHAREQMSKRGRDPASQHSASFTNDGLPLGIAYILKVLGQDPAFDALQWFPCLRASRVGERESIEARLDMDAGSAGMDGLQRWGRKAASLPPEEAHSLQLVGKRLMNYVKEVELLESTMESARVLFL